MEHEINTVLKKVNDWRLTKKHPTSPIPDQLLDEIRSLHNKYPKHKIRHIFKLTSSTWDKKILENSQLVKSSTHHQNNSHFVQLKTIDTFQKPFLKIKLQNGAEITIYQ